MNKLAITLISLTLAASLLSPGTMAQSSFTQTREKLVQGLQGSIRQDAEKARDANRKPMEVLEFFGLRDNMKVLEISPASGYWTKFLAPTLRDNGQLIVSVGVNAGFKSGVMSLSGIDRVSAINDDITLGNLPNFDFDTADLDMVLTFWNLHNPRGEEPRTNLNTAVFNALKSGGIYGVVDHTRRHGQANNRAVGRRMDPVLVIKEMLDIGFEFVAYSDMHYHSEDDLMQEVATPGVRGNTDRFTLKFRKP